MYLRRDTRTSRRWKVLREGERLGELAMLGEIKGEKRHHDHPEAVTNKTSSPHICFVAHEAVWDARLEGRVSSPARGRLQDSLTLPFELIHVQGCTKIRRYNAYQTVEKGKLVYSLLFAKEQTDLPFSRL